MAKIGLRPTEETTLKEIREAVLKHFEENPNHGSNCACLDWVIGGIRLAMHEGKPEFTYDLPEAERNGWYAVDYVLGAARSR